MINNNLREVEFTNDPKFIENPTFTTPICKGSFLNENRSFKKGYFHKWRTINIEGEEKDHALIEDAETGLISYIDYDSFRFITESELIKRTTHLDGHNF